MRQIDKCAIIGLIIMTCQVLSSCESKQNEIQDIYVISSLAKSGNLHFTLPTNEFRQREYYQQFNFIVDSTGSIFYYYIQPGEWGIMAGQVFANLRSGQIIQVPRQGIVDFLKLNVPDTKKNKITISISSQKDTIKSQGFTDLYHYLSDSTKNIEFYIRMTTIEENVVLLFKNRQEFYDPSLVKWDSTKTIFIKAPKVVYD